MNVAPSTLYRHLPGAAAGRSWTGTVMNIARLEKHDPAKNMARSYRIWVTPTLFGDYAVVREWGRIGSPGTMREEWFTSEEEGIRDGLDLRRRKERRG